MKRQFLLCLFAIVTISLTPFLSQAQAFNRGDDILGVGLGIGSSLGSGYTYGSQSPGLSVQYEHGNWDVGGPGVISLGGYLGYKSFSYDYLSYYSVKWTYFIIGLRSA